MAEVPYEINGVGGAGNADCRLLVWTELANTDTGKAFKLPGFADRSVHATGVWSAASSANIEGSNNGVDWAPLSNPQGTDIKIVAADKKIEQVMEATVWIRPTVTGGDGSTLITFALLLRKR